VRLKSLSLATMMLFATVLIGANSRTAIAQEGEMQVIDEVVVQVNDDVITLSRLKKETKERIEALKQVQDLLGECNDAVSSLPAIEKAAGRNRTEKKCLRKHFEELAEQKAAAFRKHWTGTFDAEGREEWWTGYLARGARPPAKGK